MKLANVENNTIVQICEFDSGNIPDWASTWIDATGLSIGMVDDGGGTYIDPPAPTYSTEELNNFKTEAYNKIDSVAEKARLRYVTDGAAQSMTYQLKGDEAEAYVTAGYPAPTGSPPILTDYPFVQAEVNATGKTYAQAADDIITQRNAWIIVGAQIEQQRIGGKAAVLIATDLDGIKIAVRTAELALDVI